MEEIQNPPCWKTNMVGWAVGLLLTSCGTMNERSELRHHCQTPIKFTITQIFTNPALVFVFRFTRVSCYRHRSLNLSHLIIEILTINANTATSKFLETFHNVRVSRQQAGQIRGSASEGPVARAARVRHTSLASHIRT